MEILKKLRNFSNFSQEELAKNLSLDKDTIAMYEIGKVSPSFKSLIKIINFYNISLDFLLLEENCLYPRNLKLLNLARKLDDTTFLQERNHIEITAKSLLNNNKDNNIVIKQDNTIDIQLYNDNFNLNLKNIRKYRNIKQIEMTNLINVPKSTLSMYEFSNYPPKDKLVNISEILNISIHALSTGEKLFFDFQDRLFGKTMLLADRFLSLDDQKFIIKLMENIINS